MADSDSTTVYNYQVAACNRFFQEQLPSNGIKPLSEREIPPNLIHFTGKFFDITDFDAQHVVGILSYIVNARDDFTTNNKFYLLIKGAEFQEVFKLEAIPTNNQPGNGIVSLRLKGEVEFKPAASYEVLNKMLEESYTMEQPTKSFAEHIKQVFNNNKILRAENNLPRATIEVYMIWLFEIARRLVKPENPTEMQRKYDVLPIGSAIVGLVRLLERGDAEICKFEDVFIQGKKFHCFKGDPENREKAIHEINKALGANTEKSYYYKELPQLFCSAGEPNEELRERLENLGV